MSDQKPAAILLAERILKLESELRIPNEEDDIGLVEVEAEDWNALVRLAKKALGQKP